MWIKQGRIFHLEPSANRSTHVQVPTPLVMPNGNIRVYYACRNNGRAFPAFFDLSSDLKTILRVQEKPIMTPGKPGMFDADGIMPSCVIEKADELWMYFIGWNELKNTARYQNEIGLAVSKDGGDTFQRVFEGPIIGRSITEPGLAVMPFVRQEKSGLFAMLYQSGTGWHLVNGKYEPTYVIKYAHSQDGMTWKRDSASCVQSLNPREALSRPSVVDKEMWYCFRDSDDYRGGRGSYKIGYSNDGNRLDNQAIERDDWDSDMQCYPYAIEVNGKRLMFYNGNDFGQTGIGLAIWE